MTALEALRMAVQGLISNRLRTLLTMLGITIGVASVIVLVAVGHGSAVKVNSQIESLGHEHADRHGRRRIRLRPPRRPGQPPRSN